MEHGPITPDIARGLQVLRARISSQEIPSSSLDESINIATWNIRHFSGGRMDASIHYIAEILYQFDLVAITELKNDMSDLRRVLAILGPEWKVVFSDYIKDSGGNQERIGYLYDSRAVTFTGLAAEADPLRKRVKISSDPDRFGYLPSLDWWRSPFMASFKAGHFDFMAVTAHIRFGDRVSDREGPIGALADWVHARRNEEFVTDPDIIVMGDFNITSRRSKTFKELVKRGLQVSPGLLVDDPGSNLQKDKRYDQIAHYPLHPSLHQDKDGNSSAPGGVLDFLGDSHQALYPGHPNMTIDTFKNEMSDHFPMWVQLNIWDQDLVLDQVIAAGP